MKTAREVLAEEFQKVAHTSTPFLEQAGQVWDAALAAMESYADQRAQQVREEIAQLCERGASERDWDDTGHDIAAAIRTQSPTKDATGE